ncbi:pleckstrin homology-like domain family B member 2 [Artemia franciscana]|uniref:PH domain-containing protein n=1 Tax=Artemia franciscana TaxID=6661 RepID=A0AA88HDT6_ARTSF|nr:hypothetical protein QYM36_015859 [Artemia franciscana]
MNSELDCCKERSCKCQTRTEQILCENELEAKRKKAHEDRVREEELVKEEFSRLEDILRMCAEYQNTMNSTENNKMKGFSFDCDAVTGASGQCDCASLPSSPIDKKFMDKPPPSPGHTLQQNRIITNGSLSRGSPSSRSPTLDPSAVRRMTSSEDELQNILSVSPEKNVRSPYENLGNVLQTPPSPRTKIKTIAGLRDDGKKSPQSVKSVQSQGSPLSPTSESSSNQFGYFTGRVSSQIDGCKGSSTEEENSHRQSVSFSMTKLKNQIIDVEKQITEAVSGVEMERALLISELQSHSQKLREDEVLLVNLYEKQAKKDCEFEKWKRSEEEKVSTARRNMELMEALFERLKRAHGSFCGTAEEESQILDKLKQQQEQLEHERKAFEDLEFQHMEMSIVREAEREDLLHEITTVETRLGQRRQQIRLIQTQVLTSLKDAKKDIEKFVQKRRSLSRELEQERMQLAALESSQRSSSERSQECSDSDDRLSVDSRFLQRSFSPILKELDNLEMAAQNVLLDPSPATSQVFEEVLNRTQKDSNDKHDPSLENSSQSSSNELLKSDKKDVRPTSLSIASFENSCPSPSLESPSSSFKDTSEDSSSDGRIIYNVPYSNQGLKKRPDRNGNASRLLSKQRPLTRYLPIRNDEFDLRAHIESAGHQLELCTHITVTSTSARGYLFKCGQRIRKWQKRWFVFDRESRTFSYYADKSEHRLRTSVGFQAVEEVYVDHLNSSKSAQPKLTFCVKTQPRLFNLMAPSAESMRIWVDVIFTGAEAYGEY